LLALIQLALMAVVVTGFVLSTVVGSQARKVIAADVDDIAGDAMPSVQYLSEARGLARKELLAVRESAIAGRALGRNPTEPVEEARKNLESTLANYSALPYYPEERAFYGDVQKQKDAFDAAVAEALATAPWQDGKALDPRLERAIDTNNRLDAALERLVDFNAAQGHRLGLRIESQSRAIDSQMLLADLAVGMLAMAATIVAAVSWRRSVAALKERNSELDMFAGRVAHDLLSPLMTVGMGLSLSKARLEGNTAAVIAIGRATRALERVRSLVTDLLEFARAGASPELGQAAQVSESLRDVLDGVQVEAREARVEIQCEGTAGGTVACPKGVLTSLAQNLVRNAIKFMGDSPRREVIVSARDAGPFVKVSVEDTGPGVPEWLGAKVFEPFVRGTQAVAGMGIGLATVKKLAEAYGGHVGCRAAACGGSVFWFELPRAP
jgi:signal transduction histidine kinase